MLNRSSKSLGAPMSHNPTPSNSLADGVLAGSLVTAPAWGPWLTQINQLLSTVSLTIGLILGLARLWAWWHSRK